MDQTTLAVVDRSRSLELFIYLQVLDVLTTALGFRLGLAEASPFIHYLMSFGVLGGLLASKFIAVAIGAYCVWRRRYRVITLINYWYAALVAWNLLLIASR